MKVATWNVNSLRVRLPQVLKWLEQERPDVLALQETKIQDDEFPADAFERYGYTAVFSGQAAYNGVAILSRTPPDAVCYDIGGHYVDEGTTLKRFQPRAQGRAFKILKRTSHITVVVATPELDEVETQPGKRTTAKAGKK